MANVLEDAMSMLSRKEALAARWLLQPEDVAPVVGPLGAELWASKIQQKTSKGKQSPPTAKKESSGSGAARGA